MADIKIATGVEKININDIIFSLTFLKANTIAPPNAVTSQVNNVA